MRELKRFEDFYYLKNQNCLRALLRQYEEHLCNAKDRYTLACERGHTQYPKHYPCLVTIETSWQEGVTFPLIKVFTRDSVEKEILKQKHHLEILISVGL